MPCGQCIGCRIRRTRDWAVRVTHEAQSHRANCFLTLTYAPEHLPEKGSLEPEHLVRFIKRLRKRLDRHQTTIRYYAVGEYGEKLERPHYHLLIFGWDFPDRYFWKYSKSGEPLYRSPELEALWTKGHSTIGETTWESAAYAARYTLKKINGERAVNHYKDKLPEFIRLSLKPGIGHNWIEKYWRDVYANDQVVIRKGNEYKTYSPPRYYDKWLQENQPMVWEKVWRKRKMEVRNSEEKTSLDLKLEERHKNHQIKRLKRELHDPENLHNS